MAGRKSDFTLTKLDDLFTTQAQRDEEQLSKIRDIPLELIDDFPDHPFKVRDDEDMMQLVESVKERGVITPATVRQKEDGRYELVSGHRRKRACELAGFETLRSEIVDLNRDEATILMVESNFQRSEILPSEKAFAYKMRLEAMKRQAGRPRKENVSPVGTNLRTDEQIAQETGDSRNQIHRYVRLTNLVPELLEFVDEGRIKMRPAVELSYLDEDCQRDVVDEIDLNDATPSHDQTIRMRKLFNEGNLTTEASDGSYQYSWTDENHKRRYVYSKTLEALRIKEEAIEKDKSDGIKAEARYVTLDDLYELWKDLKRGLKNNTFENYKYIYETFVRRQIGSKRVSTFLKSDIKRFYNYLVDERGLKPAMSNSYKFYSDTKDIMKKYVNAPAFALV